MIKITKEECQKKVLLLKKKFNRKGVKMNAINKIINEECYKSKRLRQLANECNFEKNQEIRKQQDQSYKRFVFFKNLNKEMGKIKNVCDTTKK